MLTWKKIDSGIKNYFYNISVEGQIVSKKDGWGHGICDQGGTNW